MPVIHASAPDSARSSAATFESPQHAGVDRHHARLRRHAHDRVQQHRLLLLEGAQHHQPVAVAAARLGQQGVERGGAGGGVDG